MNPVPYVSASLIGSFERCPFSFAMSHYHGEKGDGSAAVFGTKFHTLMEQVHTMPIEDVITYCENHFGEEAEIVTETVMEILANDNALDWKQIDNEHKFEIYIPEVGITVVGHIDHILAETTPDGKRKLIIRDYKTTWKYEPAVVWSNRIQPRCYNWAARIQFPDFDIYEFQIWYPRQDRVVQWTLEPENEGFLSYIADVWDDLKKYYAQGWQEGDPAKHMPQILGEGCKYCAVKDLCDT